jgi:hypothetical protein
MEKYAFRRVHWPYGVTYFRRSKKTERFLFFYICSLIVYNERNRVKKMSRKIMALIIFIVAVVGIYGLVYAAVTTVLMPQDLNEFKTELDSMSQNQISNSDITQLESAAATMDSSPLKYMSKSQRINIANEMRNGNTIPPGVLNQDFTEYSNFNYYKSLAYALVLKGNLSSAIKNLSSNYEEINSLGSQMVSLNQKSATDFENGDNKAYADDLRGTANLMKQYKIKMDVLKNNLQNIVNQLSNEK